MFEILSMAVSDIRLWRVPPWPYKLCWPAFKGRTDKCQWWGRIRDPCEAWPSHQPNDFVALQHVVLDSPRPWRKSKPDTLQLLKELFNIFLDHVVGLGHKDKDTLFLTTIRSAEHIWHICFSGSRSGHCLCHFLVLYLLDWCFFHQFPMKPWWNKSPHQFSRISAWSWIKWLWKVTLQCMMHSTLPRVPWSTSAMIFPIFVEDSADLPMPKTQGQSPHFRRSGLLYEGTISLSTPFTLGRCSATFSSPNFGCNRCVRW